MSYSGGLITHIHRYKRWVGGDTNGLTATWFVSVDVLTYLYMHQGLLIHAALLHSGLLATPHVQLSSNQRHRLLSMKVNLKKNCSVEYTNSEAVGLQEHHQSLHGKKLFSEQLVCDYLT